MTNAQARHALTTAGLDPSDLTDTDAIQLATDAELDTDHEPVNGFTTTTEQIITRGLTPLAGGFKTQADAEKWAAERHLRIVWRGPLFAIDTDQ